MRGDSAEDCDDEAKSFARPALARYRGTRMVRRRDIGVVVRSLTKRFALLRVV